MEGKPHLVSLATSGFDSFTRTCQLSDGSLVNCQIYDTAGQEKFNSLSLNYYKRADAILLVYDVSERTSFEKIQNFYVKEIKNNCKDDVIILLIGNKADKEESRTVECEEGINLASEEKYEFKESSCLKNQNVAGAFEYLVETWNYRNQIKKEQNAKKQNNNSGNNNNTTSSKDSENLVLGSKDEKQKNKKNKGGCC